MPDQDPTVQDLIRQAADKYGVPHELALGVADQESGFNPTAVNPQAVKGEHATGTFQLLPSTAKRFGVDPSDPQQNIQGGVQYLRELLDQHKGNVDQVLANYGGVKTDTEYVPSVRAKMGKYAGGDTTPAPATASSTPATAPASAPIKPVASHVSQPPPVPRTAFGRLGQSLKDGLATANPANPQVGQYLAGSGGRNLGDAVGSATKDTITGYDPRTDQGQRNIAGTVAGIAAGAATGGTGFWPTLAMITAAGGAGAATDAGQQLWKGTSPKDLDLSSMGGAALEQGGQEAVGQAIGAGTRFLGNRLAAPKVAKNAAASLNAERAARELQLDQALRGAEDTVRSTKAAAAASEQAVGARLDAEQPAVNPKQAGTMVADTLNGPVKTAKDQLGDAVGAAAKSGPAIPTAPLKARLDELSAQITPMASHAEPPAPKIIQTGPHAGKPQLDPAALASLTVPADHPLPGALAKISEALSDQSEISFEDAHKIKRLLDDVTTWDSPAKTQVKQITKGFRQTLREAMSSHEPYNQATAAYSDISKLTGNKTLARQIQQDAVTNPERIVKLIKPDEPTKIQALKDLLLTHAADGGGKEQGQAAWDAVSAAWTHKHLITGGPEKLLDRIGKMDPDFRQVMFDSDPAKKLALTRLEQIGHAFQDAQTKGAEAIEQAKTGKIEARRAVQDARGLTPDEERFKASGLAQAPPVVETGAHVLRAVGLSPLSFWGGTSTMKLLWNGVKPADLIDWASRSDKGTQLLIKTINSPWPGFAISDLLRLSGLVDKDQFQPPAKDRSLNGPPTPRSAQGRPLPPAPPPAPR